MDDAYRPAPPLARAVQALTEMGYTFGRNRRASRFVYSRPGKSKRLRVTEKALVKFRRLLIEKTGFDVGSEIVRDAVKMAGYQDEYDPVVVWLDGLEWDGVSRAAKLFSHYFGADESPLNSALSELTLVTAVRRARSPGCSADHMIVLAGPTGAGKTKGVRALARKRSWYSDADILGRAPERQLEALDGIWIYEVAELVGNAPLHHERNKAFLSRRVDSGRRAYAHDRDDTPRACVFIGTTDKSEFFFDPAGNRRFHPVAVTKVKLKRLRRDIDQVWAEAAYLEKNFGPLVLPKHLWDDAAIRQSQYVETDPWLEKLRAVVGQRRGNLLIVRNSAVLDAVGLSTGHQTQADFKRGAAVMKQLGYERWQGKLDGERARGFCKRIESESEE